MGNFCDVEIKEYVLEGNVKIAILIGGLNSNNPKQYMDDAVSEYVERCGYNEFIEEHLDNPWVRVIIRDFNSIKFEKFNDQRLSK